MTILHVIGLILAIGLLAYRPRYLLTEPGVGYRLAVD